MNRLVVTLALLAAVMGALAAFSLTRETSDGEPRTHVRTYQ